MEALKAEIGGTAGPGRMHSPEGNQMQSSEVKAILSGKCYSLYPLHGGAKETAIFILSLCVDR
jgi:hypothetical protein